YLHTCKCSYYSYTIFFTISSFFLLILLHPPRFTLFPYTTLFRSLSLSSGCRRTVMGNSSPPTRKEPARLPPTFVWITCASSRTRSEEHTSELQSRFDLVCRLLLEKKK